MSDEPEFVDLSDGWSVADEQWWREHAEAPAEPNPDRTPASFVSWREFADVNEVAAEALLGTRSDTILPADGIVLMYGDGGAGKTTLTLDAVVHMADGREWLGLEVGRPVRSLVIENEGPRAKFRQIIDEKLATLNGSDAGDRLVMLDDPWSRFTLSDAGLRADVAAIVNERELDVIVLGPLATVGMVGGGTPDEISAFERLLMELRGEIERPVAFWIVHHENKSGDVSGAWERVPDTLAHVQSAGNGHTRFVFRKARWSSELHGKTLNLAWSDGRTFSVVEDVERDLSAEALALFEESDEWRTGTEVAKLLKVGRPKIEPILAELVRTLSLETQTGPPGRNRAAKCWRLRSATILSLVPETPEAPSPAPPNDFDF